MSSHIPYVSVFPHEEATDKHCNKRAKKITIRQLTGEINSTRVLLVQNRFGLPTIWKHATQFERYQQKSAREKVAKSSTLKRSGRKKRDIFSLVTMNAPPSISGKANNANIQNALMPEKIIIDASFHEQLNKLKIDWKSDKLIKR